MSNIIFNRKYRSCFQLVQCILAPARSQSLRAAQRLLLLFSSLSFLFGTSAFAANCTFTCTVKAGSGGDYATIQSCIDAMSPSGGYTCIVYTGSYAEMPNIKAGTTGNYNVLTVNPGDAVSILGSTVNSHTKINGFTITNPLSPSSAACVAVASQATDFFVTNNVMESCGDGAAMIRMPHDTTGNDHGYIQGNTLSWGCSTSSAPNVCEGMIVEGDVFLIENNNLSHVSDGVSLFASHTVFRNNTMQDTSPSDCGSNSSNCHIDFVESEPTSITPPAHNNLYEGNYQTNNSGINAHMFLTQADLCVGTCSNVIIRYNHTYKLGSYWLLDNAGNFSHVKNYNNTVVCALNGTACSVGNDTNVSGYQTSTSAADVNNIYYNSLPSGSGGFYPGNAPFRHNNNLSYTTACAPGCTFVDPFNTEVGKIVNQDPLFVNATSDWHLQSGSPAIAVGAKLATATNSGSASATLNVDDSDYFQDGMGLTANGVQADWIRIGASTTVQISSIVNATTITLASPASWSAGDPIYLYKNSTGTQVLFGSLPDLGAYPFSGGGGCATPRDSNTGTATGSIGVGQYSTAKYMSMPFTAGSSYTLCGVTLRMAKITNPSNMNAYIYGDNSGVPGTLLGTGSASFNSSTLSSSEGDAAFVNLNASLTAGTKYWIVVELLSVSPDGIHDYTTWYYAAGGASNVFQSSPDGSTQWHTQNSSVTGKFTTLSH